MAIEQVLKSKLESKKEDIQKHLDFSFDKINNVIDQVFIIDSPTSKFSNPKIELTFPKFDQFFFIGQSDIIQETTQLINSKIKDQIQLKFQLDKEYQQQSIISLQSQLIQQKEQEQEQEHVTSQIQFKPFKYQIIKENSIKQAWVCYAVAFNKDCSSVAAGCYEKIKIYQFNQGTLTEIQVLKEHKYAVVALNFMKLSNQLISGDSAGLIFIWSVNGLDVQSLKIMKIYLSQAAAIRPFDFGLRKMNGSVNSQSKIVLHMIINQVQMIHKIKLYLVELTIQYQ